MIFQSCFHGIYRVRRVNETVNNVKTRHWDLCFIFICNNKAALLSLSQTTFRLLVVTALSLCIPLYSRAQLTPLMLGHPKGCSRWLLTLPGLTHNVHTGMGCADVNLHQVAAQVGWLLKPSGAKFAWWSWSFWVNPAHQHLLFQEQGEDGEGTACMWGALEACVQAGGLSPLEILAAHREAATVVSVLLSWVIFQGMEPAVWVPRGRPAASTGSTRLRPRRRRRGTLHPNPIISGELQHLKWFVLHKVHSLH